MIAIDLSVPRICISTVLGLCWSDFTIDLIRCVEGTDNTRPGREWTSCVITYTEGTQKKNVTGMQAKLKVTEKLIWRNTRAILLYTVRKRSYIFQTDTDGSVLGFDGTCVVG